MRQQRAGGSNRGGCSNSSSTAHRLCDADELPTSAPQSPCLPEWDNGTTRRAHWGAQYLQRVSRGCPNGFERRAAIGDQAGERPGRALLS